jgi:ketosteroid isomerase-like protein
LIEDQKPEILSLVAQGDQVAVVARERGQVKATGAHYDIRWLQLFTFHGGKIVRVLQFCDNVNAFAA